MTLSASTVAKGASYCAALAGIADGTKQARYYATSDGSTNSAALDIVADVGELTFAANALSSATQNYQNPRRGPFMESWTVHMCWTIAYGTLDLITAVEFMNGRRPADSGDTFRKGATKFDNIQGILTQAGPNYDEWTGDSAEAYDEANQQLVSFIALMKKADQQTADIVQCQAGQVEELAEELAAIKLALVGLLSFLSAASRYATNFNKNVIKEANIAGATAKADAPAYIDDTEDIASAREAAAFKEARGAQVSAAGYSVLFAKFWDCVDGPIDNWLPMITFVACCSAVTAATLCTLRATSDGFENKDDIAATEGPAREYGTVALAATELINSLAPAGLGMRTANTNSVSRFWDLIALSDTQDAHSSAPTVAGTASGSGRHHAPVGTYARASDGHWGDRSAFPVPQPQASEDPQAPPLAVPVPAPRHQSSGPAAAQSEDAAAQMNLGDREGKRMPSVPFAARQPAAAKKPAPVETVFAHAVAVAGAVTDDADEAEVRAAPGAADTQGVPAEVATAGTKPARERSWAERNMW